MAIITTPVAWFTHQQFRAITMMLNNITQWTLQEWVTELNDPDDPRLYEKNQVFTAYRAAAVVDIDVAVSPNPATKAIIAIAGGLNVGDTITVNGNDTSGGGSVAYPEVVYTVTGTVPSDFAAQSLASQIAGDWGLDVTTTNGGTDYDATILINNLDSLEITGAAYVSNLPAIPTDAG
jgi:hypothetical protein